MHSLLLFCFNKNAMGQTHKQARLTFNEFRSCRGIYLKLSIGSQAYTIQKCGVCNNLSLPREDMVPEITILGTTRLALLLLLVLLLLLLLVVLDYQYHWY